MVHIAEVTFVSGAAHSFHFFLFKKKIRVGFKFVAETQFYLMALLFMVIS